MQNTLAKLGVIQNLGLIDRALRIVLGAVLIGVSVTSILNSTVVTWQVYVALFAIYPLMTGMLGWDPLYAVAHTKSCDLSDRNRCGTFPYQIDAMLGHNPISDKGYEYDHSLSASHHERKQKTA